MRYQNNILEFDKNGKRYVASFDQVKCDAFIYDSFNSFKIISGLREEMSEEEKQAVNDFVSNYEIVISLDELKENKLNEAKQYRKKLEARGITINDMEIDTSRDSLIMISTTLEYLKNNVNSNINFKTKTGFVSLGFDELNNISNEVSSYIQSIFNKEAELIEKIKECKSEDELNSVVIPKEV